MQKIKTNRTIDPALIEMLPVLSESAVLAFLAKAGTKAVTVVFSSVDGKKPAEVKSRNVMLRATSRLVGSDRGKAQGEAMKTRGQIWGAKPSGGSVSFYGDRVHELRGGGEVLTARGFNA
jgi:hypothetical protein